MSDPTCEDRIQSRLESRLDDFATLNEVQSDAASISNETKEKAEALGIQFEDDWRDNPYYVEDDAWQIQAEYPLGISEFRTIRVDLSTGGPGDWFEIMSDYEGRFDYGSTIVYHFHDWFDHAEVELHSDEYDVAWNWLSNIVQVLDEG